MKLIRLDVRFFRSFNYDYELKAKSGSQPAAWEATSPAWHPFVKVPIEPDVTAIVGANEAGKSQLLAAIQSLLTGESILRADFCRYSELFSVQSGALRFPEFGGTFRLEPGDPDLSSIPSLAGQKEFSVYRPGEDQPFIVVDGKRSELSDAELALLTSALPTFHVLRTDLAIPDSVSIAELAGRTRSPLNDRRRRGALLKHLSALPGGIDASTVGSAVLPALSVGQDEATIEAETRRLEEFGLARQLLVDAAHVDPAVFIELEDAVESGREGQVEAIVGAINAAIRENLNIQRWWSQDRAFELRVEARERELAFTIQDRTASKYSFNERSQGLRFFLSYFVQLTAHRIQNRKADLLLLDEPDAYLSSTGQQDLLRVLEDYSSPEGDGPRSQVIYVTHSPFLIDKNAPHRIRVLDKGSNNEGTRVVKDAANNRYEPLRSSLGQYVAETAFIGGKNLFVEGQADQVLLAGINAHLLRRGNFRDLLDLNEVTIVAAGGADGIPYMVYLARGRDALKPPCVALLDGDESGKAAERLLQRGEVRQKRILDDRFIVRIDKWARDAGVTADSGVIIEEIEDLIPVPLVRRAALNYLARFVDLDRVDTSTFTSDALHTAISQNGGKLWNAVESAYRSAFPDEHIEKVGLARELINLVAGDGATGRIEDLEQRFGLLLQHLSGQLEIADIDEQLSRSENRLKRAISNFERDHTVGIKKSAARRLLREIEGSLADAAFADEARTRIQAIIRDFALNDASIPDVDDFEAFRDSVRALRTTERLAYQDDAHKDPSAEIPDEISKTAANSGKQKAA